MVNAPQLKDLFVLEYSAQQGYFRITNADDSMVANLEECLGHMPISGYIPILGGTREHCESMMKKIDDSDLIFVGRKKINGISNG